MAWCSLSFSQAARDPKRSSCFYFNSQRSHALSQRLSAHCRTAESTTNQSQAISTDLISTKEKDRFFRETTVSYSEKLRRICWMITSSHAPNLSSHSAQSSQASSSSSSLMDARNFPTSSRQAIPCRGSGRRQSWPPFEARRPTPAGRCRRSWKRRYKKNSATAQITTFPKATRSWKKVMCVSPRVR